MPDEKTRGDSVRLYLTGAASDGGAQTNPDQSLGKYRSSTELELLGITVTNPISNVTVIMASGMNGIGDGTLTATDDDNLKWTPPGETQGDAVTIANGETKLLEGGGDDGHKKSLRVSRTSADALSGTATVALADVFNDVVGFDNISTSEASAGDTEYRCICLKNVASAKVEAIKSYVGTLGPQRVSGATQLPASGAGAIEVSVDDFADWDAVG